MASSSNPSASVASETQQEDTDSTYKYVDFACSICELKENCFYGKLACGNGRFGKDVYYMRDPFEPPSKRGRKPMLFDFLVLGTVCHTCLRASCSIFFMNHFCVDCISRERRSFPDEVIQLVSKAQDSHIQFNEHSNKTPTN